MPLYGAIDLHANNNYVVVLDSADRVVLRRRLANMVEEVLRVLAPFRQELAGVVVESTYNWYWLVDGLQEAGYPTHLANTAAIRQYEGIKHTDDWSDAEWLGRMLRLGVLPEGFIYPKQRRPVRDLLRKRFLLIGQRTAQWLSLGNLVARHTGGRLSGGPLKEITREEVAQRLPQPQVALSAKCSLEVVRALDQQIDQIEKEVKQQVKLDPPHQKTLQRLQSVWGVGEILGLTILLETGPLSRFPQVGDYSSYCRAVSSQCLSNGRKKGHHNVKCGNRYLAWAYVEAANYAARYYRPAQAFVSRKTRQANRALAIKALANKLCRASYYVMRDSVKFEPSRLFGSSSWLGQGTVKSVG